MTKVKDVLVKYHKIVPFPWTVRKLKKAGLNPTNFLIGVGQEIEKCDDSYTETAQQLLDLLKELEMTL